MSVLEVSGLTVAAGGAEVLREVSFTLAPGRVMGLVGESGAGKSMIGRVLGGALPEGFRVASGHLRFRGEDLGAGLRAHLGREIAFIPQEPLTALNPLMTVAAQFSEHLGRIGIPRARRRGHVVEALASVGLPDPASLADRYPFQLSGGMCQRVLIAMAFASRPALVVADEPTTALDVSTQARIIGLIRELQHRHGTAMVFITHDLRLAARVCDEIAVLYAGEVVEQGPAAEVMGAPRHPYARALRASIPGLSGPLRRLVPLPDTMPGIAAYAGLPGCRFAPRCPVADPACAASRPGLQDLGGGHLVRCTPACLGGEALPDEAPRARPVASGSEILRVEGLCRHYPAGRDLLGRRRGAGVMAVRDVGLSVRAGEFLGIVGESGSGKSTLARLIMGLETPSSGHITVDGRAMVPGDTASRRIRLGTLQLVFQDPQSALNPRRRVAGLVTQAMEARSTSRAERAARARALLAETGLPPEIMDRLPGQLSGGQKQRVNIARALCVTPRLLVADEIVSGLDVSVQAQIVNLLLDLRADLGIGLVLISHDLGVVRHLCDRVAVMRQGAVVEEGPVERVLTTPAHPYTRQLLASIPPDDPAIPWTPETLEEAI